MNVNHEARAAGGRRRLRRGTSSRVDKNEQTMKRTSRLGSLAADVRDTRMAQRMLSRWTTQLVLLVFPVLRHLFAQRFLLAKTARRAAPTHSVCIANSFRLLTSLAGPRPIHSRVFLAKAFAICFTTVSMDLEECRARDR